MTGKLRRERVEQVERDTLARIFRDLETIDAAYDPPSREALEDRRRARRARRRDTAYLERLEALRRR